MDGPSTVRVKFLLTLACGVACIFFSLSSASFETRVDFELEDKAIQSIALPVQQTQVTSAHAFSFQRQQPEKPRLKLPTPIFVLGYPKSGTTSIWNFFTCSGVVSQHFCCCGEQNDHPPCKGGTMARCILRNMGKNQSMLEGCGDYDVYAQLDGERPIFPVNDKERGVLLDDGTLARHPRTTQGNSLSMRHFLPQHFHLDKIHQHAPHATYILTLRDPIVWANSAFKWFHMRGRFINEYIAHNSSIERPGKAGAIAWLARIYSEHSDLIREFVRQHPTHALVEVNITAADAGKRLAVTFGLSEQCWGHHNKRGNRTKLQQLNKQ